MQEGEADEAAKVDLHKLKIKWEKIVKTLKEGRVSPLEARARREEIANEKDGLIYRYAGRITGDTFIDICDTIRTIRDDLDLALRNGRQNYDDEKYKRITECLQLIIKILSIPIIAILIAKFLFNFNIPFLG